jgi:putative oxidoreductase
MARILDAGMLPVVSRILMVPVFWISGIYKVLMPAAIIDIIAKTGAPFPVLGYGLAVAVELLGGLALLLGWKARHAAWALAVYCVATSFMFHNDMHDPNAMVSFWKNFALAGGFLQLVVHGAGPYSLDARRKS